MTARVEIVHRTGFRYDTPVAASYNEARMTPMTTPSQQTLRSRVVVHPVSWESTYLDYWGSQVTAFEVNQPHEELEVTARSVVELVDLTGLPGLPGGPREPATWATLRRTDVRDQQFEMVQPTARTEPPDELSELAAALPSSESVDEAALAVCRLVHERIRYLPGSSAVHGTATEAWAAGAGVCQDFVHLAVGGLRSLGIPARYVSGYLDPRSEPVRGETVTAQSHAWLEWWSGDWTGYDPTNAIEPSERHVVVGRGRDYTDVAPLKGVYSGTASSTLFVEVQIRRLA